MTRSLAADPYANSVELGYIGARKVDLPSLLAQSDFVVVTCLLNEETRHLIGAAQFAQMKRSAYFINVARGPIVDESALALALAQGRLAGAGLDVLTVEPPSFDNPLLSLDNVVFTPHVASHVATVYERMSATCVRSLLAALDGKIDRGMVVNGEVLG